MTSSVQTWSSSAALQAPLQYLIKSEARPAVYAATSSAQPPKRTGTFESRRVPIRNARTHTGERWTLDGAGFELREHLSGVSDFRDEEQVRTVYYPEATALVAAATGATRVLVFDHTVRLDENAKGKRDATRAPVRVVHNDYTVRSGRQRVRDLLPPDEATHVLNHRFAIVNVWRSIGAPIETTPLAVADARSVAPNDLLATDLIYPDRTGEFYQLAFSPEQRWFYFPKMQRDEALLIKCYDSADDGTARFTAHSAFDNPAASASSAPRESIEIRTLISYAPTN